MSQSCCGVRPRFLHAGFVAAAAVSFAPPFAAGGITSLTQTSFEDKLRTHPAALVAFVSPWCIACRSLNGELSRVQALLAQRRPDVFIAQVDASRETQLAARYRAQRAPVVLFFPDTRLLAPGLQVTYRGQLLHANLIAFVHASATSSQVPRLGSSVEGLRDAAGTFVGFFRDGNSDSMLIDLWDLDCIKRYNRRYFVVAHGPDASDGRELWRWAGLEWSPDVNRSKEAVLFLREPQLAISTNAVASKARFTLADPSEAELVVAKTYSSDSWRDQVDAFCAWTERQVLDPVTIFDASRAAALDGTFDWLLLLFISETATNEARPAMDKWADAPENEARDSAAAAAKEIQAQFPRERDTLREFIEKARQDDPRYLEVLPVLVPAGDGEVQAFREHFVTSLSDLPTDVGSSSPWQVVLFNTRTRKRYKGQSWGPGQEPVLRQFIDSVLRGSIPSEIRSSPPRASQTTTSPVAEVTGLSFEKLISEPVMSGRAEALLLIYASWCSHSIAFMSLWAELASGLAGFVGLQRPSKTGLVLAQIDGMQNEHPDLPHVSRFPTLRLCLGASDLNSTRPRYVDYDGASDADSVHSWLREHSLSFRSSVV